jgi:hypothetical protein
MREMALSGGKGRVGHTMIDTTKTTTPQTIPHVAFELRLRSASSPARVCEPARPIAYAVS